MGTVCYVWREMMNDTGAIDQQGIVRTYVIYQTLAWHSLLDTCALCVKCMSFCSLKDMECDAFK